MAFDLFEKKTSLVDTTSGSRLADIRYTEKNKPAVTGGLISAKNAETTRQTSNDYLQKKYTTTDWNNALSDRLNEREYIANLYRKFYSEGSYTDSNGNLISGLNPYDYADRVQFAQYLHELFPELSVDYFMQNAESFLEEATGVKSDIKTYGDHISNVWNASWQNFGTSMANLGNYVYYGINGGFGTQAWENKKQELAEKRATSGANYRKDLGDEKYDSLVEKMISGTAEQSPQIALMLAQTLLTGGAAGINGYRAAKKLITKTAADSAVGKARTAGRILNFFISGMTEAGGAMQECYQNGFSDDAATAVGLIVGLFTGCLETFGDETLLKPLNDAVDTVLKLKGTKQVVHEATQSFGKWLASAAADAAKNVGASMITEPAEEVTELAVSTLVTNIAASVERNNGRQVTGDKDWDEFWEEAKDTAVQTMLSTPLMTLGGNFVGTAVEGLLGQGSMQWTPSSYMNREGATDIRGNATVVPASITVNSNLKDAENGKANPIKGYTVGHYFFVDGEVTPKQSDLLLNGKNVIYTKEDETTRYAKDSAETLQKYGIDSEVTLTADQADSYLASMELEKKLDSYTYVKDHKIKASEYSEFNDGANSLYIKVKDSGETIKINIGEENSGNLSGLKDLTGVEYKKFEEEDFVKPEDIKTTKKKESAAPKQEQTQQNQKTEETVAQPPEDEDDLDVFKGTAQENTVPNDKEYLEGLKNKEKPESLRKEQTAKSFDAKAKLDSGYRAETHEYYNEKGELETKDINNVRTVKMTDKDGNTSFVRIDNLNTENFKKILSLADDFGENPLDLQQRKNYAEKVIKQKNEAMKTAGIEKSSTEPVQRVKDTQIATQSNDSSTQQNTTEQTAETTPQATVSQEQAQTTEATTEAVEPQQAQGATTETATEETQTESNDSETTTQPEAVTPEQAETTEEKVGEKAADTTEGTVTETELDEATETLQKDRGIEREPARGIALLAKGLKDLFKALGHEIDYKKAVSHLNVSTLAKAKTFKDRISVFLDLIVDHPYGKELFKEVYGDKRMTKKARAEFKEEITNVLYGRKSNLDESTYTKLEKLIKPTLATVINQSELTAEEQRLAEELKQKETKKAEEDPLKKAKEEETKLTKEEKKQAKKKAKEDVEAETLDKHQKSLRNSAYWLARGAYEYWLNQSLIETKNDPNRKERLQKVANTYKEWLDKIAKGDYNTALQFVSTLEARRAEQLVEKYGDFEFEVDSKDGKKKRKLNQSALKYGEEHTADETQEERAAKKMTAREAALKEAVDAAMKLYSENRQVRTVGETQYTILTAYQLNKMNLALSGKINEEINAIVNDILSYTPAWSKRQVIVNDNGEPVLDKDGNYQYETVSAGVADAKYISDLFAYLEGIIEAADTDISNTIASKTDDIIVTDTENREEQAKVAVKDLRPVVAFAILSYFERNSQAGSFDTLIQQIGTDGFHDRIENVLSDIRLHHDDWLLTPSAINAIQNVLISDFTTRQNGVAPEKLKEQKLTPSFSQTQSRAVDTSRYASSFMFDTTKGKYYIDTKNAYNELIEVLSAAQGENPNMAEIRKNAQLGAIFLSSLSEDLQDSFVRKSISADKKTLRASLAADTNESLFRLFFTTAESAQTVDDSARGATLPQSAKILLSPYANASTLKHEPIHVIWNLDPSIRERAKVEYKAYFEEDPDGVQIRTVVEKDPDRFGGYTADDIVRGLKRLTEDDFDYLKETDPEEALAYMFEAYDEKRDLVKYSDGIKGIMEKIAKFLHTVADKIQKFFGIDILHETNNKIFSLIFADQSEYEKFSEQAATQDIDLAQFNRPFTRTLAMSNDGSVRVLNTDRGLMITHGISIRNFRKVLSRGGRMSTPSLAIAEPLNIPSYGGAGITFIGNKDMAQRYIESGWVITAGGTGNHPKTTHINSPFGDTALARAKTINEMLTNISNFFHEINNAYDIYSGSFIDESLRKKEVMPRFTEIEDSFKSAEIESENDAINLIKETVQKLVDYKNEWEAEKEIRNISNIISEASGGLSSFDTYFENISAIYGPISSSPDRTYLVEDDGESIAVADDGRFLEDTPEDVTFFLKRRFEGRNYSKLNSLEDARRPRSYGRSYFEAKPQETVSFSDFQVALVQTADLALFEEIKKALEPFGLPVYQYGELSLNKGYNSLVSSVKGQAEQLKFQTISSALNEIKNDSKSGEEKKQKMTQYEELVYKYVMNPAVDTLKTVETWRKENNGFFADKDSISTLRAKLESNGLFHNVDIQTELTAEMKDEIKESVTKRIAYSTEDYLAWGKKLGTIGEKIHDKDQNSVFVKEALYDLFGYKEVTINGKKVIKPTGLISKILSNVKRSASTKENWLDSLAQSIIDRRNEMLKNGELVVTDYEAAHNLKPLRADVIYKLLDKGNWTASDTKKSRNTLKGNKGYDSLVFDINSMDISVADIENFIRVLTVKSGNTYLPFTAQVGVEGFGMALEGPLVTLLNYAHVSDDINKNKFQANSLDNTDEDFLKAAYNNMKGLAGNSIDSSIYLLDKSKRDLIYAIMQLKKDGLLTGIYGLDVTAEEFKKNFLDAINGLVEEAEKNAQKVETLKSAVDIDSYDATARFINDVQNLLNRQAKIVNKVVGQSGLSENEVNKLIKQVEDLQTEMQTREEKFNEEVKNGINEATNNELIKLKNEIASKDVTIADLLKKNDELKKEAKNGVSNILSKKLHLTSEQIKNMDGDTTKLIEAYNKEIENLNNKINGFKTANTNLKAMVTEREERIKQNLNIANSMKEDFNKASVLPLFENTKKNMKHLISRATSDVQQKLDTLMEAIYKPISAGDVRRLDVRKALKFNDVFKSGTAIDDAADNYIEYREDANKLANWVASVMLQKSENGNAPFVAKTLDQLTAGQLSELHGLIADVVNDSRKYYKEANQKEVKYHSQWRKNIASEFLAYAQSSGVNIFELGEDDSIGINDSKSNKLKSLLAELIEDFRIQSAKYRNNYPTLYAYLFGGIDHEGNVWGGLNDAQNGLINQVQKRTSEINSLLIKEFSNSKFFKGKLTEKNLQSNLNAVKNGYKTQLKEAEFTDEARQSTGLKIEKVMKGKSFEYVVSVDEDNKSAMREVARWQGEIEKRRRELQDKVKKYTDKYKPAENAYNAAALVYANLLKSDSNGYDDYYSISSGTDDYFNDLLDEAEKAEKKAKNHFDKIKDGLEKAQKELELLKTAGTRPNENTSKYTTQELLGIYLIARQRGGLDRLIYATRLYTDENVGIAGSSLTNNLSVGNVIDVIKMIEEDPQFEPLKHMADKISSIVSDRFEEVRDTRFFISKGTDYIESVDDYFGFFVEEGDFDYGPDLDLDLELAKAEGSVNTNAKAGDSMVKKRTGAYGLNLRALETAKTQIYRQEYYINFGKKIENIKDLIRDEAFQSNVKIAEGREAGRRDIRELVEFTNALGNATKTVREGAFADAARIFTNNTAASAMMFRATTILIQIPTLLVSMREKHIGIKGVLKGMARAFNDDSIDRLSPQMRDRMNGYIKSIKETNNLGTIIGSQKLEKIINTTQGIGLKGLEIVDNYVAEAMWYAYYDGVQEEFREQGKDKNLTAEEFETLCANEATQRVMDITPVQQAKDNAFMYNNKNAFVRNLLLFTNQSAKMLNMFINDADDIKHHKGNRAYYVKRLFKTIGVATMISLMNGIIKGTLFKKTKDDDDDEAEIHLLSNIFSTFVEGATDYVPFWDTLFPSSYGESTILTSVDNFRKVLFKDADERTENQMANACAYVIRDVATLSGLPSAEGMAFYRGFAYGEPFNAGYLYNNTIGELFGGDN